MPSSHSGRLHLTCNQDLPRLVGSNPTEGSTKWGYNDVADRTGNDNNLIG